jgi:hypothetical protein
MQNSQNLKKILLGTSYLWFLISTPYAIDLSAEEIVNRAVARSEAQMETNTEAKFESKALLIVDSVDGEGKVTKSEKSLFSRYPIYGAVFEELIQKEGRPLTEKEARKEKERRDDFIEDVKKRIEEGKHPQPEDEREVRFNREFMNRYNTELVGEESLQDYSCWVIYFEPKEGKLPSERRMDEALNRSTGKLWISKDDFGLARVEFEMREPIRYLAGLLATVRNTEGRLNFERIESNVWFPVDFELKLDLRILFKNIRRNITMKWSEYRRAEIAPIPVLSNGWPVTSSKPQVSVEND